MPIIAYPLIAGGIWLLWKFGKGGDPDSGTATIDDAPSPSYDSSPLCDPPPCD